MAVALHSRRRLARQARARPEDRLLARRARAARRLARDESRRRRRSSERHRRGAGAVLAHAEQRAGDDLAVRAGSTPGRRGCSAASASRSRAGSPRSSASSGTTRLALANGTRRSSTWAVITRASSESASWVMPQPQAMPTASRNAALTQASCGRIPPRSGSRSRSRRRRGAAGRLPVAPPPSATPSATAAAPPGAPSAAARRPPGAAGRASARQCAQPSRCRSSARASSLLERVEDVGAQVLLVAVVRVVHAVTPSATSARRSFSRPSRIRPFTVPIGISSISAIWLWLKPPK